MFGGNAFGWAYPGEGYAASGTLYDPAVVSRAIHLIGNVGVDNEPPAARAIHVIANVGSVASVAARAIHLIGNVPRVAVSQEAVEVLFTGAAQARLTQEAVEVLVANRIFRIDPASETDQARPLTYVSGRDIDPASETDAAQPLTYTQGPTGYDIDPAAETDQAQSLTITKTVVIQPAEEDDHAPSIWPLVSIEPATETDQAMQLVYGQPGVLLTQAFLEVTGTLDNEGRLTQVFLEVLTNVCPSNAHIWQRFRTSRP